MTFINSRTLLFNYHIFDSLQFKTVPEAFYFDGINGFTKNSKEQILKGKEVENFICKFIIPNLVSTLSTLEGNKVYKKKFSVSLLASLAFYSV